MIDTRALVRFARYTSIGVSTFTLDMVILYLLTAVLGFPSLVGISAGFIIGLTVNYFLSRHFVFKYSERSKATGYAFYLVIGGVSLTSILILVGILQSLGMNLYVARVFVSIIVGFGNYLTNLYQNFRVAGKRL